MSTELMLKVIMEDLTAIKNQMGDVIRTTEIVKGHQAQITQIVNKFDSYEQRLGKTENAVSTIQGKSIGNNKFVTWVTALASAFLIAVYLNSTKPVKGAVLPFKESKIVKQIITSKGK